MSKLVISGYYGFGNMGDEALLAGMITAFRRLEPKLEITVLSAEPGKTAQLYGVKAVGRYRTPAILKELLSCDIFVSGGGSLFQDVTGWKTVPYYSLLVFWARLLGKNIVFYAQGLGPLEKWLNIFLFKKAVGVSEFISVRDQESCELLQELDVNKLQIYKTADPVFSFRSRELFADKHQDITVGKKPVIGISVRPWNNEEYLQMLARGLNRLAAKISASIIIIPMHYQSDYQVSSRLAAKIEVNSRIFPRVDDPRQLLAFFSELDFVIGLRLHSLIFAAYNCVPFLGIAYDPKVSSFVNCFEEGKFIEINDLDALSNLDEPGAMLWENREDFITELEKKKEHFFQLNCQNAQRVCELL